MENDASPLSDPEATNHHPPEDLGFGAVVSRESRKRLLNRDGTFNVRREGLSFFQSLSVYHWMLTVSWPAFLGFVTGAYLVVNALFAIAYRACGAGALRGPAGEMLTPGFGQAFFFSVHTLATIGYGTISPGSLSANLVVTAESIVGLFGFAIAAGLMFARFSRPVADILFSERALIGPYADRTGLMFRITNRRNSQIVELKARVLLSRRRSSAGRGERQFVPLRLERDRVALFPLTWTVVHPIDGDSPLFGSGLADLEQSDAEILVLLSGFDETFSQTVHTRSSYKWNEILFGARFASVFLPMEDDGVIRVDVRRLNELQGGETPATSSPPSSS